MIDVKRATVTVGLDGPAKDFAIAKDAQLHTYRTTGRVQGAYKFGLSHKNLYLTSALIKRDAWARLIRVISR